MSTLKPPKSISRRQELREDKVVTAYARAYQFADENRTMIYAAIAGIIVLILLIVGWVWYQNRQGEIAQDHLGRILTVYERGDYRQALDGTEARLGLRAIADDFGRTDAGNMARFYAADAHYQLGEYDQAREYFARFSKSDDLIGASALAGEAAIYESRGEFRRAGDLYRRAAQHYESAASSPQYFLSAGRAYEAAGEYDRARDAYQAIVDNFPESQLAANVDAYIARADARRHSVQ
jgi:tetratricopeptide (TPR) repeat protein